MAKKVVISVLIAFLITISFFMVFMNYYYHHNDLEKLEKKFYSQNQQSEKRKVVLLGDSQMAMLNATYINENLKNNCCVVYNLAIFADRPEKRLESINQIIAMKPDLVVYGIGFLEFENLKTPAFDKPNSFLPDPEKSFNDISDRAYPPDFDSPKFVILKVIRGSDNDINNLASDPYSPFFSYDLKKEGNVKTDAELGKNLKITKFNPVEPMKNNKGVIALKEIIQKLQANKIKVIIVTTPFNKYYLDNMPKSYDLFLNPMVKILGNEYNIKTYELQNKYAKLDIWYDIVHVAVNRTVTIYNDDISKIVSDEVSN